MHFADIAQLLQVLQRLVDGGNTVLVIEHNLDVIKTADYVIDLGPEGGDKGGRIVATGTPEEVAQQADSHTGRYFRRVLSDLRAHIAITKRSRARRGIRARQPRAARRAGERRSQLGPPERNGRTSPEFLAPPGR